MFCCEHLRLPEVAVQVWRGRFLHGCKIIVVRFMFKAVFVRCGLAVAVAVVLSLLSVYVQRKPVVDFDVVVVLM